MTSSLHAPNSSLCARHLAPYLLSPHDLRYHFFPLPQLSGNGRGRNEVSSAASHFALASTWRWPSPGTSSHTIVLSYSVASDYDTIACHYQEIKSDLHCVWIQKSYSRGLGRVWQCSQGLNSVSIAVHRCLRCRHDNSVLLCEKRCAVF